MTRLKKTKTPSASTSRGWNETIQDMLAQRDAREKAQGETLVSEYKKRLDVRQARDEISKAGRDAAPYGTGVLGPDGKHIPIEEVRLTNPPGAQSSPEMASLAASYMEHEDPNVRSLAATVLRLVRE